MSKLKPIDYIMVGIIMLMLTFFVVFSTIEGPKYVVRKMESIERIERIKKMAEETQDLKIK